MAMETSKRPILLGPNTKQLQRLAVIVGSFLVGCSNQFFFQKIWRDLEYLRAPTNKSIMSTPPWVWKTFFSKKWVILRVKLFVRILFSRHIHWSSIKYQDIHGISHEIHTRKTTAGLGLVQFSQRLHWDVYKWGFLKWGIPQVTIGFNTRMF